MPFSWNCERGLAVSLHTVKQTCERLSVSRSTLHNWKVAGILVPVDLPGRMVRYRNADISAIEEHGAQPPKPAPFDFVKVLSGYGVQIKGRARSVLERLQVTDLRGLAVLDLEDCDGLPQCGAKTLEELRQARDAARAALEGGAL